MSGKLTQRPAMKAMLAFLKSRRSGGTVVIIDDVSRLARGIAAHLELRASIAKAGGILESPSIEFGDDSDSQLVEHLLASVSQHQRQKNGEQTKNRMRARILNGYWVFKAPSGYLYQRVSGQGRVLIRDDKVSCVIEEALEGFASGRFDTQADVARFLQDHPLYTKDASGLVRRQRVADLLRSPVYAGYVEAPDWGVSLRKGQHEGLIGFEVFQKNQDRLNGVNRTPKRSNLNEGFPLRGYVCCAVCETPYTSCWSTGSHGRYPYYLCQKRGCEMYGKSIRRDDLEGAFEALLLTVKPSASLFKVARAMFEELWDRRMSQGKVQAKALASQLAKIEKQVAQLLERVMDARVPTVIAAYENKIEALEKSKLLICEKLGSQGAPKSTFEKSLERAMEFLSNPWNLWSSGRLEDRRTVLKLVFAKPLYYNKNTGYRTADLSLPFKMLGQNIHGENLMVRSRGLEPPRVAPQRPQRCASTNSAMTAYDKTLLLKGILNRE